MKKLLAVILAVFLLLAAGTIGVFAARYSAGKGYVDADNNGVCDNIDESQCAGYADEDRDGICDNREETCKPEQNYKKSFVDNDDDGVCDNRGECKGQGKGCGNKQGRGVCYTDSDGDGVCDNRGLFRRGK